MISVFGSDAGDEEAEAASRVIRSNWLGFGKECEQLERELARFLGTDDLVLLNSGTSALHMAVHLMALPAGSEVIVPSLTWVSCAHAVRANGLVPVFCDVDPVTFNVTADTISPHITARTSAIMVVHYAGLPIGDIESILSFGFPVIEDAAHAVCSAVGERKCGTFGNVGVYSFDGIKNIAMGEAGGLVCNSPELMGRARILRYSGIGKSGFESVATGADANWWEYSIHDHHPKMLPSDVTAAIGRVQLQRLGHLQDRRRSLWDAYQEGLAGVECVTRPGDPPPGTTHSYFTYLIQVPGRDGLARFLLDKGIYTTFRYHPLHMTAYYRTGKELPVCEHLNKTGLNLPLHPRLTMNDCQRVIELVREFYSPLS